MNLKPLVTDDFLFVMPVRLLFRLFLTNYTALLKSPFEVFTEIVFIAYV